MIWIAILLFTIAGAAACLGYARGNIRAERRNDEHRKVLDTWHYEQGLALGKAVGRAECSQELRAVFAEELQSRIDATRLSCLADSEQAIALASVKAYQAYQRGKTEGREERRRREHDAQAEVLGSEVQ